MDTCTLQHLNNLFLGKKKNRKRRLEAKIYFLDSYLKEKKKKKKIYEIYKDFGKFGFKFLHVVVDIGPLVDELVTF